MTPVPRIRARGWLMAENEIESAAMCYVAAVRDANGHVTASPLLSFRVL